MGYVKGGWGLPPDWQAHEHSGEERARSNVWPSKRAGKEEDVSLLANIFAR